MKKAILVLALSTIAGTAIAAQQVDGYVRKDGTYVAPHYRSAPNDTKVDNYSSQGNVNPYNGNQGTKDPYAQPNPYGQPPQPRQPRGY